jgi:AbrB family looped-hinge helix DNA binding protein
MVIMKISSRGRVVIPARIRKKYNLRPGDWVRFVDYGGIVFLVPASTAPHKHGAGVPKGGPMLTEALLDEHRKELGRDG